MGLMAEKASKAEGVGQAHHVRAPGCRVCGITDVGCVRGNNEDGFYVADDGSLLIVADGLGGHPAGQLASQVAIDTAVAVVDGGSAKRPARLLGRAIDQAHQQVLATGLESPSHAGMATTLIAGMIEGDSLHTCHVGDVRGYVLGQEGFERLTTDHSYVGELVGRGELSEADARCHPERNIVTQAIGLDVPEPDFSTRALNSGDTVLLCSDGLWDAVDDEEMAEILSASRSARRRAADLIDRAIDAGGHDNITAVLYQHS